ncbi:HPr family phosphocarrier protein [Amorphus orientalis]|uniref:Phosphocarrier protein HPr n=1 Tax=Amorphus orientalis TaxID=649198 RepID=A0AAE4ASQ6_9HYPH|nr:HPr family phosphocarrier protein [Amorphus orientalis]MDQ0315342.1 phosphocarrier protein [Amorphus orientalis]
MSATASTAEASVVLTSEVGLHARPAVKLTQEAAKFSSTIELSIDDTGTWHNAKSVVKLMKLKARTGSTVHLRAEGEDAEEAVAALVSLVERDFDG